MGCQTSAGETRLAAAGLTASRSRLRRLGTHMLPQNTQERPQIVRPSARRAVDARHVEALVHVRHDIPKPGGECQPLGELALEEAASGKPKERVGVARRCAEVELQASGHGEIQCDLRRLPEVEDDRIRRVGRGQELFGAQRQAIGDALKMALDRRRPLGQHLTVEWAQAPSLSRTRS